MMNPNSSQADQRSPQTESAMARRLYLSALHRKKIQASAFKVRSENGATNADLPTPRTQEESQDPVGTQAAARAVSPRIFFFFAAVFLGVVLLSVWAGYAIGHVRGKALVEREIVAARIQTLQHLPASETEALNHAMVGLRSGQAEASFLALKALRAKFPQVASLSYLNALAALETGRYVVAEALVEDSVKAGQRVSDCLALLSMLEGRKSAANTKQKPGEAGEKSEALLRAAITADAANPYPRIELANLLRVQGRTEEARSEFQTALALLTPQDSHQVVDLALAVMKVEQIPVEKLTAVAPATGNVRAIFPAAYAAMRRGDMPLAGSLLEQCRELVQADLFNYLMNDPAVRKFAGRQELRGFYAPR